LARLADIREHGDEADDVGLQLGIADAVEAAQQREDLVAVELRMSPDSYFCTA
jgi:hypothetical protein